MAAPTPLTPAGCVGKLVVRSGSSTGTVIGKAGPFTLGRSTSKTVNVTLAPAASKVTIQLYQREPTGTYLPVATRAATV